MKKQQLTLIEILIVLLIIVIVFLMFLPIINAVVARQRYLHFCRNFGNNLISQKNYVRGESGKLYGEFPQNEDEKAFAAILKNELIVASSSTFPDIRKSKTFLIWKASLAKKNFLNGGVSSDKSSPMVIEKDLYSQWVAFTGNPKKLSRQQWETFYEANFIKEAEYTGWKQATGNPQGLSEKEFKVLRDKKLITFPAPS